MNIVHIFLQKRINYLIFITRSNHICYQTQHQEATEQKNAEMSPPFNCVTNS